MAIHSSVPAWRIPWTSRGAWWATVHGVVKESDLTETEQRHPLGDGGRVLVGPSSFRECDEREAGF